MKPTFVQFPQGQYAYNTDLNNFAPSIGAAWSVPASTGFLSKLLGREEGDSVFRGGFGTAYERPGMSNFTDVFGTNPGLRITGVTDRTETNGNIAVGALLRNPAQVSTPNFSTTPSYPITASIGQSVNIIDSNLQIPYAQSWTVGWQRKLSRNSVVEARYVGSRHVDDWVRSNINEINVVENGFINEFRKAQSNLRPTSRPAEAHLRVYRHARHVARCRPSSRISAASNAANAGDPARYTSTSFTDSTFLQTLAHLQSAAMLQHERDDAELCLQPDQQRRAPRECRERRSAREPVRRQSRCARAQPVNNLGATSHQRQRHTL